MRKKPGRAGLGDPPAGPQAGDEAVALAGQWRDRGAVMLEVRERREAGGLSAGIDTPGRGRGAQRRGQARLGDGVPEAQTGEPPVLGHRVQHQQVSGGQQVGLTLRLRKQVAAGLVEDEECVREAGDESGDQRRRQRRPSGVVGRAQPAQAGAPRVQRGADGGLVAGEACPVPGVDQSDLLQPGAGQPRGDLALAERRRQRDGNVVGARTSCATKRISSVLPLPQTTCAGSTPWRSASRAVSSVACGSG